MQAASAAVAQMGAKLAAAERWGREQEAAAAAERARRHALERDLAAALQRARELEVRGSCQFLPRVMACGCTTNNRFHRGTSAAERCS